MFYKIIAACLGAGIFISLGASSWAVSMQIRDHRQIREAVIAAPALTGSVGIVAAGME